MSHSFKLSRRIARFRVPVVAILVLGLAACDNTDSLNPDSSIPDGLEVGPSADPISAIEEDAPIEEDGVAQLAPAGEPTLASASFAGGIPMGTYALPTEQFGSRYNGALRTIAPTYLLRELSAIKNRGGKVVLMLAGNPRYYTDAAGNFSLTRWKERVNRFRNINFASYVNDGTVMAHYLIDEPNDPSNWNGRPVPPSVLEEMAAHSKSLWPGMVTVVRVDPGYLGQNHRHLDAAWAQYVYRKGTAADYIRRNVADAQARGLGLITGMNIIKGGPNGSRMTARQIEDWGLTILANTYTCAFISWQWNDSYLSTSAVRSAMDVLRRKAQSRSQKSCRS